jgi:hypothetical protein
MTKTWNRCLGLVALGMLAWPFVMVVWVVTKL